MNFHPNIMPKRKFIFRCTDCGKEYARFEATYLCPDCARTNTPDTPPKGVLKIIYRYETMIGPDYWHHLKIFRFLDLLPIDHLESLPKLRVGETPLYHETKLNGKLLNFNLYLKDDSQNPTFSFKDRASAIVSAHAKENDIKTIVAASTGNAGSSLAGMCASQGQKAVILVPENAPAAKLTQIVMYGAKIIPVKGTYDDAFDFSIRATEHFGWYNRNTAYNPLTIEGKKTVSFELYEQLKHRVPDRIFVPVGDGVIISGVYKGFEDLMKLGIIRKMPVIVAVQSEGSNNLVRNLYSEKFVVKPSTTIADSISVDIPRNYYMTKQYMADYAGECEVVTDNEIVDASLVLSRNAGIFTEPAAAAAYAGMLKYMVENKLSDQSCNVVLLTGSGLKDVKAVQGRLFIPEAISPNISELERSCVGYV
jgi:threonine synthase